MKNFIILSVCFTLAMPCSGGNTTFCTAHDKPMQITIKKTKIEDKLMYLQAISGKEKLRILSFANDSLKVSNTYSIELTSFLSMLIELNVIPLNYLDIDLSKVKIKLSNPIPIDLKYNQYRDLFLTPQIKDTITMMIKRDCKWLTNSNKSD